jgi:arylsulfatase
LIVPPQGPTIIHAPSAATTTTTRGDRLQRREGEAAMTKMRLRRFTAIIGSMLLPFSTARAPAQETAPAKRPNIVLIMSDDMGYSDLGCYGGEHATPNLDALAAAGVRFTQFYNTARCCSTRASLLTGLYPHQAGIGHMMQDRGHDGYRGVLNRNCVTIAEALRPAG